MAFPWAEIGIAVFLIAVTLFITLPLFLRSLKKSGREERAAAKSVLADGIPATAFVKSIHPTNTMLDDAPIVILELDVRLPNGEIKPAAVRTAIQVVHLPAHQPGSEIAVKYKKGLNGLIVAVEGAYLP